MTAPFRLNRTDEVAFLKAEVERLKTLAEAAQKLVIQQTAAAVKAEERCAAMREVLERVLGAMRLARQTPFQAGDVLRDAEMIARDALK